MAHRVWLVFGTEGSQSDASRKTVLKFAVNAKQISTPLNGWVNSTSGKQAGAGEHRSTGSCREKQFQWKGNCDLCVFNWFAWNCIWHCDSAAIEKLPVGVSSATSSQLPAIPPALSRLLIKEQSKREAEWGRTNKDLQWKDFGQMQRNRAAWLIYGQHGIKLIIYACPELGQVCCLSRKLQKKRRTRSKTLWRQQPAAVVGPGWGSTPKCCSLISKW